MKVQREKILKILRTLIKLAVRAQGCVNAEHAKLKRIKIDFSKIRASSYRFDIYEQVHSLFYLSLNVNGAGLRIWTPRHLNMKMSIKEELSKLHRELISRNDWKLPDDGPAEKFIKSIVHASPRRHCHIDHVSRNIKDQYNQLMPGNPEITKARVILSTIMGYLSDERWQLFVLNNPIKLDRLALIAWQVVNTAAFNISPGADHDDRMAMIALIGRVVYSILALEESDEIGRLRLALLRQLFCTQPDYLKRFNQQVLHMDSTLAIQPGLYDLPIPIFILLLGLVEISDRLHMDLMSCVCDELFGSGILLNEQLMALVNQLVLKSRDLSFKTDFRESCCKLALVLLDRCHDLLEIQRPIEEREFVFRRLLNNNSPGLSDNFAVIYSIQWLLCSPVPGGVEQKVAMMYRLIDTLVIDIEYFLDQLIKSIPLLYYDAHIDSCTRNQLNDDLTTIIVSLFDPILDRHDGALDSSLNVFARSYLSLSKMFGLIERASQSRAWVTLNGLRDYSAKRFIDYMHRLFGLSRDTAPDFSVYQSFFTQFFSDKRLRIFGRSLLEKMGASKYTYPLHVALVYLDSVDLLPPMLLPSCRNELLRTIIILSRPCYNDKDKGSQLSNFYNLLVLKQCSDESMKSIFDYLYTLTSDNVRDGFIYLQRADFQQAIDGLDTSCDELGLTQLPSSEFDAELFASHHSPRKFFSNSSAASLFYRRRSASEWPTQGHVSSSSFNFDPPSFMKRC